MRTNVALLCAAAVCAALNAKAASPETGAFLASARDRYDASLKRIESDYAARTNAWAAEYAEALRALAAGSQRQGDLTRLLALTKEESRFRSERRIPEAALVAEPTDLRALQDQYRAKWTQNICDKHRSVLQLGGRYGEFLLAEQKRLTMKGAIDDAVAVKTEINRAAESPEAAAAKEVLAAAAKPAEPPPEKPAEPAAAAVDAAAELAKAQMACAGVQISRGKEPPGGGQFKKVVLKPCGYSTKDLRISLWSSERQDTAAGDGDAVLRHVRVSVTAAGDADTVANPTLAVQHLAKQERGPRQAGPRKVGEGLVVDTADIEPLEAQRIPLSRIDQQEVWLDLPPLRMAWSKPNTPSGSPRLTAAFNRDFFGAIVTVFDSDGRMVCQGVTDLKLRAFAPRTLGEVPAAEPPVAGPPPGFKPPQPGVSPQKGLKSSPKMDMDAARKVMDAANAALRAARQAYLADRGNKNAEAAFLDAERAYAEAAQVMDEIEKRRNDHARKVQ